MWIPKGFFRLGDTLPVDPDVTAMDVGSIDTYRVIYTEYKGAWNVHSPDLPSIFAGSETRDAADNQCKFGCVVGISEPTNVRWHLVVTK